MCLNQQTVKIAWRCLTDYHILPQCIQYSAAALACGALYYAIQVMGIENISCDDEMRQRSVYTSAWWSSCGTDDATIVAIATSIANNAI